MNVAIQVGPRKRIEGMRLKETREINRPIAEVFAYTADFSNVEEWDPGVKEAHQTSSGATGVGTTYHVLVKFGAREIPMTYEITEYERDSRVVLHGKGETLEALDDIKFTESPNGTLVDYTADLEFKNWIRFFVPLMSPMLKNVGTKALDGLVESLST